LIVLFGTGLLFSAELDDSTLFIEAFNASQKKDYLLAIEKIGQLNQLFPDTPLRDVSLLLLARAGMKAGDNQLAAKTVNQFSAEFSSSTLKEGIEKELLSLGNRLKNGERLEPVRQLQIAAGKIRDKRILLERAAAEKAEQLKLAREKLERERIAKEKAARESIRLVIAVPEGGRSYEVDGHGQLLFELINRGVGREEFRLVSTAAPEYALTFKSAANNRETVERILIGGGKKFKGAISFKVPHDRIDGQRVVLPIRVVSGRFADISFSKDIVVSVSAPLLRAVAKPSRSTVQPGETFQYRVMLINAGSLATGKLKG
jgi:hypothetical protein